MPELHSVVCLKVTPKPEEITVDNATRRLQRVGIRSEINPPDMNALELALDLRDRHGGLVTLLSMGPPLFKSYLAVGLAMGADRAFLLSDRAFSGADTLATSYTLAQGIRQIGRVDLVICGEESSDGATGHVPPGLAEWLCTGLITMVDRVEVVAQGRAVRARREAKGGYEILETALPAVISVRTAANEPRFMDYGSKERVPEGDPITVWSRQDLAADESMIGEPGSPTRVSGLDQAPARRRRQARLTGSPADIALRLAQILAEEL